MADGNGPDSQGKGLVLWGGGALAGVAAAALVWFLTPRPTKPPVAPEPVPATAPAASADTTATEPAPAPADETTAPAAEPSVATTTEAEPAGTEPAAADPEPAPGPATPAVPSFDTVRAETDGSALVAGTAEPGAEVVVVLDGAEVGRATADAAGKFAAFLTLEPSAAPRVMGLLALGAGGTETASTAEVVLGPIAGPEIAVAEAGPEPAAPASEGNASDAAATSEEPAEAATPGGEAAAPQALIVDDSGVRKLAQAAAVEDIRIDTISYDTSGAVSLAGRGRAGAFARLYLDNGERATVGIGADGTWQVALADVAPGLYTLRVDQVDGTGKVTSRFETPFLRETPEAVAAAQSAEPEPQAPAADTGTGAAETAADAPPADTGAGQAGEVSAEAAEAAEVASATPTVQAEAPSSAAPAEGAAPVVSADAGTDAPVQAAEVVAEAPAAPAAEAAPKVATRATIITVQPGFTLWGIARQNYGDGILYVRVYEANKEQIRDPDLIYPGQVFSVPAPEE